MRLFRTLAALFLTALPVAPLAAQTTGFPFVNDLTVNGIGSGSTSCNLINIVGQFSTFQITAAPNSPCLLLFDFCGCQAGTVPFPATTCPITMPQSYDLWLNGGCVSFNFPGATNGAGVFSVTFPPSIPTFTFGVQGALLSSGCGRVIFTQAYDVII